MSKNKLIIAAAGSGKTTRLVKDALSIKSNEYVLITTFTEACEEEIKNKIIEETGGFIPSNITVQTWFSFLLEHGVRPYQDCMRDDLFDRDIGFHLVDAPSSLCRDENGKILFTWTEKKNFMNYYFSSVDGLRIHSDKVAEFVCKNNEKTGGRVFNRMSKIFSHIFIDEVQDLSGWDLDILTALFDSNTAVCLVGDPRQGTYSTSNVKKNAKYQKSDIVNFFEHETIRNKLTIDSTSLVLNHRCNQLICDLSNRLFPLLGQTKSSQKEETGHDGVFIIKEGDVDAYLAKYPKCVQLRNSSTSKTVRLNYNFLNFGKSKGLTFDRVLIFPTNPIIQWLINNDSVLPPTSICKFYVALTRARYSVAIVYDYNEGEVIDGAQKYYP